jgi:spermidine synthase
MTLIAALAAAATLGLQVVLPRIFSMVLWYHLGFFAVSLAMLGFSIGGLAVMWGGRRAGGASSAPARPDPTRYVGHAGLWITASLMFVCRLPLDPTKLGEGATAPLLLLLTGLALAVPFALLGCVVCAALAAPGVRVTRVYAATFIGGAAGAALSLVAMQWLGAPRAVAVLAALPLIGWFTIKREHRAPGGGGRIVLILALLLTLGTLARPELFIPLESRKHFPRVPAERVLDSRWNAFSHVTFYDNPDHHGLWSLPASYAGPLPRMIGVAIDAWAITSVIERAPGEVDLPVFAQYPPTIAYTNTEPGFSALVIGAGGGIDVLAALAAEAGHVAAVEINPLIVEAVLGRFAEWSGDLYRDPRVEPVVSEGRHFVETDERRWDRIVLSGVDTFAATEAGAFALSENSLYTVEAFETYLRRLEPDGSLMMTRWWFEPPRQTLRLALTAAEALRRSGVAEPARRLFVARAENNSLFLMKNSDFTREELDALLAASAARGAVPIFALETPSHPVFVEALVSGNPVALVRDYPYRIDPATDDRPFFFETTRFGSVFATEGDWIRDRIGGQEVLVMSLAVLALLCIPLLLLERAARARAAAAAPRRALLGIAALGLGYMLVEVPLLQRLTLPLGHPVLAVSVVLVALLLWSGIGSLLSARLAPGRLGRVAMACAVAVALSLWIGLSEIEGGLIHLPLAARILGVIVLLAPAGLAMGMPFPLALRALSDQDALFVPSAFLWNGLASVLAGPLAVVLGMELGFQATLLLGALCYALAGWLLRGGARPAAVS